MRLSRPRRPGRALAMLLVVGLLSAGGRALWANGVFSSTPPGFSGQCRVAATLPVQDIEVSHGVAFMSVAGDKPGPQDGIYALPLKGGVVMKLAGTPSDFHPRGLGLWRTPDGKGLFLYVVNHHAPMPGATGAFANGRFSIDSYEVASPDAAPRLVPQGVIESGLMKNPQDVAAAGPGSFYVANGTAGSNAAFAWLLTPLQHYGVLSGGNILYFDGMSFRPMADGLYGTRSLMLTRGGGHLIVGGLLGRSVTSFSREALTGKLTEDTVTVLRTGPERLALDAQGNLWLAGHSNLGPWRAMADGNGGKASSQVLRVGLIDGNPGPVDQVYGNDGAEIAGAGAVAVDGQHLLIGSAPGKKLLDCTMQ